MSQQYPAKKFEGTAAERRKVMADAAHLLNRLRGLADEAGEPLNGREEDTFWKFISLLPKDDQSSVIN